MDDKRESVVMNTHRFNSMDILRGFAILGMLVANLPWHVGNSMSRVIEPDFSSALAWFIQYLVFDQRFMPIFCLLFGAGFWVVKQRFDSSLTFTQSFIRRMMVLLTIGIAHAYLIWPGDILITYAFCGLLLCFFQHLSVTKIVVFGCLLKCIDFIFIQWPEAYYLSIDKLLFAWWVDIGDAPMSAAEAYAGSYADLFSYNAWRNQFLQWTALPYFRMWKALGLMLLGVAAYRVGFIQGSLPRLVYKRVALIAMLIGFPLVIYGTLARVGINPTLSEYMSFHQKLPLHKLTFGIGTMVMSFAYIALFHLYVDKLNTKLTQLVGNVGKLALTNYLMQSVLLLLLFHGLKIYPFDQMDHDLMWVFILSLWAIHLTISWWWQRSFSIGPAEYLYKRLIY